MLEPRVEPVRPRALRGASGDDAVSPVVGMILVLAISVASISAVVYWGLPAIEEMKANVEFRTVEGQFHELDGTIRELVAGTTQRTAKRWQPSISSGEIQLVEETQGWLYATELYAAGQRNSFAYASFSDGDDTFVVKNVGDAALPNVKVEAYLIGASSETQLSVSHGALTPYPNQMSGADLPLWGVGEEKSFRLSVRNVPLAEAHRDLSGSNIFRIKILSGSSLVGEAWYMQTGHAEYRLMAGLGEKTVALSNGAVLTGSGADLVIRNTPPMPPPVTTGGAYRVFARAIVLDGSAQFAGLDRFDSLLSLYGMSSLASYDCATDADCVQSAKIFIYGDYRTPWHTYLTNANRGYGYAEESASFSTLGTTVTYLEDHQGRMAYTLLGSTIKVEA